MSTKGIHASTNITARIYHHISLGRRTGLLTEAKRISSVTARQIHTGIQARNLVAITITHQGWLASLTEQRSRQTRFHILTPARVMHFRIYVGVETVFIRLQHIPGSLWFSLGEADLHNGFDALETIFPGHNQTDWSTVLRRHIVAIHTHGH